MLEALAAIAAAGHERAQTVHERGRQLSDAQVAWVLEPSTEVAKAWLHASTWARGMQTSGVEGILGNFTGTAALAIEAGQPLYCWSGPGVSTVTYRAERVPGEKARRIRRTK
jgi:hypothetical protein